jgi:hypothetical protein
LLGLETGGGAGAMMVAAGSFLDTESSIKVVPSAVQKLSQPSENVWLQVGQRFIIERRPLNFGLEL